MSKAFPDRILSLLWSFISVLSFLSILIQRNRYIFVPTLCKQLSCSYMLSEQSRAMGEVCPLIEMSNSPVFFVLTAIHLIWMLVIRLSMLPLVSPRPMHLIYTSPRSDIDPPVKSQLRGLPRSILYLNHYVSHTRPGELYQIFWRADRSSIIGQYLLHDKAKAD